MFRSTTFEPLRFGIIICKRGSKKPKLVSYHASVKELILVALCMYLQVKKGIQTTQRKTRGINWLIVLKLYLIGGSRQKRNQVRYYETHIDDATVMHS